MKIATIYEDKVYLVDDIQGRVKRINAVQRPAPNGLSECWRIILRGHDNVVTAIYVDAIRKGD